MTEIKTKDLMRAYALSLLNTPYSWGGDDPMTGYDCSGLVVELLKAVGLLKRDEDLTAAGLRERFPQLIPRADFGDLAFYGRGAITHVGFCLNSHIMIEAGGGGSTTTNVDRAKAQNAFIRLRPINNRNDILCITRPNYTSLGGFE